MTPTNLPVRLILTAYRRRLGNLQRNVHRGGLKSQDLDPVYGGSRVFLSPLHGIYTHPNIT